jgi:hypothetical protein
LVDPVRAHFARDVAHYEHNTAIERRLADGVAYLRTQWHAQ